MNQLVDTSWLFVIESIGSLIASITTLGALGVAVFEYRRSEKARFEDIRPNVVLTLSKLSVGDGVRVHLRLHNIGNTAARNVTVDFADGDTWHYVSNPDYPFLEKAGGLSVIAPGDRVEYFLGRIDKGNPMDALQSSVIIATVNVDDPRSPGKRLTDRYPLTLHDVKYLAKPHLAQAPAKKATAMVSAQSSKTTPRKRKST